MTLQKNSPLNLSTPINSFDDISKNGLPLGRPVRPRDVFPGGQRFLALAHPQGAALPPPALVVNQNRIEAFGKSGRAPRPGLRQ